MRLNKISKEFESKLAGISAGVLSSDEFEKLINIFEAEIKRVYFTASSEANLFRIINGMYDKVFLIRECVRYPHYVEILTSIAANSNYLTDILVINPEYFYWIVNPSTLNTNLTEVEFKKEIKSTISEIESIDDVVKVKAGRFTNCIRINGKGSIYGGGGTLKEFMAIDNINIETVDWYAAGVGLIKRTRKEYTYPLEFENHYLEELEIMKAG